jgi:hypothetical protein
VALPELRLSLRSAAQVKWDVNVAWPASLMSAGSSVTVIYGTGQLPAQSAQLGVSWSSSTGLGFLQGTALSGSGVAKVTGSGVLLTTASLSGSGVAFGAGQADLSPGLSHLAGSGLSRSIAAGVLSNTSADIAGAGASLTLGNAPLAAYASVVAPRA